jgi:hypothetical protein
LETFIKTTDLYEAAWHLLNGAELTAIQGIKVNGKVACELTFTHPQITQLQLSYFQSNAEVNLLDFRRAFARVHAWVHSAKKKYKNVLKNNLPKEQMPADTEGGAL